MKARVAVVALALSAMAQVGAAQQASMSGMSMGAPLADALRMQEGRFARILPAALETFPADKWTYKPTPAQMSVAEIAVHLAEGNDQLCSVVSGETAPTRDKIAPTDAKEKLLAQLKATFDFCGTALAKLDDSKLGDQIPLFGRQFSRAAVIMIIGMDWQDHYSQLANYLRINGMLPPTAQPAKKS
ncbi:MAG TPA: DinB family protein [Gemmatimonadales bacterium]|nr:DinB family protein [Gemmatimonadales bacterium]